MRIRGKYLYPIITAVMFPIVLLGSWWGLDAYAQWRAARGVEVSRSFAEETASVQCFARSPAGFPLGKWRHSRIVNAGWFVWKGDYYFDWPWRSEAPGTIEPAAIAVVDAHRARIIDCRFTAPDF
jgi:hypothetical protein